MATGNQPISSKSYWKKGQFVDEVIARQLRRGSVSLVIGAGASFGFGLPSWEELVRRMYSAKGMPWPSGSIILPRLSDSLRRMHFAKNDDGFARFVRECLFSSVKADASTVLSSKLLQALGALIASSTRGRTGHLISFNFDDLLEVYLSSMGFLSRSVTIAPYMRATVDIDVLHPHGLLPSNMTGQCSRLVFTELDYDRVIGKESEAWNRAMAGIMSSTTCIFIGLSGEDQRLRTLLTDVQLVHPILRSPHGHPYWGIRPTIKGEVTEVWEAWAERGVAARQLQSYDDIPSWLFGICQLAARLPP